MFIVDELVRIGVCVVNVGKFICIGLNYVDYVVEFGMVILNEFEVFSKVISVISGFNDNIIKFKNSEKLDWEVEFVIVIGKYVFYVNVENVNDYIVGYCVCNDVFECNF